MTSDPQMLLREVIEALGRLDLDVVRSLDPEALDRALIGVSLLGSALTAMRSDDGEVDLDPAMPVHDLTGVVIPILDDDDPGRPESSQDPHEEAG